MTSLASPNVHLDAITPSRLAHGLPVQTAAQPPLTQARAASSKSERPVAPPAELRLQGPAGNPDFVSRSRDAVRALTSGQDPRLLVIVGPCSIDDPETALEYARRLARIRTETDDALLICMRTYFEKPRTTVGWKGLFSDPHVDGSHDVEHGLKLGLDLLRELSTLGVPCASELLEPLFVPYVKDWLSWGAVGARTTESQIHRQLVSTLPFAVGFKNSTDGSVAVAVDAMRASETSHHFPSVCENGRLQIVESEGNPHTHVVLRGGKDGPNFEACSVATVQQLLASQRAATSRVMIDCSHDNCGKDYRRQPLVARDVAQQIARGGPILGVMLESYLVGGKQAPCPRSERRLGQSLTDGCLSFEDTEAVLGDLAASVRAAGRCAR